MTKIHKQLVEDAWYENSKAPTAGELFADEGAGLSSEDWPCMLEQVLAETYGLSPKSWEEPMRKRKYTKAKAWYSNQNKNGNTDAKAKKMVKRVRTYQKAQPKFKVGDRVTQQGYDDSECEIIITKVNEPIKSLPGYGYNLEYCRNGGIVDDACDVCEEQLSLADKTATPKYAKGQRVWHVDNLVGEPGYVVMSVATPKFMDGFEYMLHRWPNGYSRSCMEKELTPNEPKPPKLTKDDKLMERVEGAIQNRDLQIGVLKDQLHEVKAELDQLKIKTQGNLGVLIPQLQKERNEYMQYYNNALKTMDDQANKIKRLQGIVNAYVDGRL